MHKNKQKKERIKIMDKLYFILHYMQLIIIDIMDIMVTMTDNLQISNSKPKSNDKDCLDTQIMCDCN